MRCIYYLLSVALPVLMLACQEQEIAVFDGNNAIYFDKYYTDAIYPGTESADSTVVSFFFYSDDTKDVKVPLLVNLLGEPLKQDMKFRLKVVDEATTANKDEYTLEDYYVFTARPDSVYTTLVQEYIYIQMHKSQRLASKETESVRLVLELVPEGNVVLGQLERRKAKIILTTKTEQPVWWDETVEETLLGKYSDKKYKTFLNAIPGASDIDAAMIQESPDKVIQLVLRFKIWLTQNPTKDENGEKMEVVI